MLHRILWRALPCGAMLLTVGMPVRASCQTPAQIRDVLTLAEARARARAVSAELRAASWATTAAEARTRQAGAFANPSLSWSREYVSRGGVSNSQDIVLLEQRLDVAGQRSARRSAASLYAASTRALIGDAATQLDYDVADAYSRLAAGQIRATVIGRVMSEFDAAVRTSRTRYAEGDVSAYADRRLQIEFIRLAARTVAVERDRDRARAALIMLVTESGSPIQPDPLAVDTAPPPAVSIGTDSLIALAFALRAELRALAFELEAGRAEASLARRERTPPLGAMLGYKRERAGALPSTLSGLVIGLSAPLPLWDRRSGAIDAAGADVQLRTGRLDAARRRVRAEVIDAHARHRSAMLQLERLEAAFSSEAIGVLAAIDVAYAEGEATLVEWLDAKRARLEVELLRADVLEDFLVSRAALERAVGGPLP